jgi:hypothetical protein
MKLLYYFFAVLFGFTGIMNALGIVGHLAGGGGVQPVKFFTTLLFLFLAYACWRKARAKAPQQK